jgi:hypothetical protein
MRDAPPPSPSSRSPPTPLGRPGAKRNAPGHGSVQAHPQLAAAILRGDSPPRACPTFGTRECYLVRSSARLPAAMRSRTLCPPLRPISS